MIPPFDEFGLLPVGQHPCTLHELKQRFCWNSHRNRLLDGFERYLAQEWAAIGVQCPIYVDGSFTRSKQEPDDIDIVFDLSSLPIDDALPLAFHIRSQHDRVKQDYHCDLWTRHPMLPKDLLTYFQYVGDKAGAELNISPKALKGLIRLMP